VSDERPDLEEELRRLFGDERLSLPVAVTAEQAVLTGARRRRRRRLAMASAGGVLAVAAVLFLGSALTGIGGASGHVTVAAPPHLSETLTRIPSVTTSAPVTTSVPSALGLLGPDGVDGLRLGMSQAQVDDALQTGAIAKHTGMLGRCVDYDLMYQVTTVSPATVTTTPATVTTTRAAVTTRGTTTRFGLGGSTVVTLLVSPVSGVVQIGGAAALRTPEGVYPGMSRGQLDAIYPRVVPLPGGQVSTATPGPHAALAAPVPGQPSDYYVFAIGPSDTVQSVWLRRGTAQPC
jgi:hypothetical protein